MNDDISEPEFDIQPDSGKIFIFLLIFLKSEAVLNFEFSLFGPKTSLRMSVVRVPSLWD